MKLSPKQRMKKDGMKTHLSEEIEDFLSGIKISLFFLPILQNQLFIKISE